MSVSGQHDSNSMKRNFCLLSSETYRRISRQGLIDHTFQFGVLPLPMDLIADTTSPVPSATESMTGSTVPEIVNSKILESTPINAREPVVIPTGQSPYPERGVKH